MTERLTKREYDGSVGISALRYYNYDDFQKMAKKLAYFEDLQEQGRLVVLPEEPERFKDEITSFLIEHSCCPEEYGFKDYVEQPCRGLFCEMCWEKALKGE